MIFVDTWLGSPCIRPSKELSAPSPEGNQRISTTVKSDANGVVTLPAELCRAAGVGPGSELVAEVETGRIVLATPTPTLAERIVARARALPPEFFDALPADGASQHDHYIYGVPKRPE